MKIYNDKKIIVSLVISIAGLLMVIFGNVTIANIGSSLLASSLVILLNVWLVDVKISRPIDNWGIEKIYSTRSEKNADSDPKLEKAQYQLDGVAFGLKSFRSNHTDKIDNCLQRGVNIRLLVMDPDSPYADKRDEEEGDLPGHLRNSINQLVEWADNLNNKNYRGKIVVKGYSSMTLDFYWRVDGEVYIGPYWYGIPSQQTITYKFTDNGKGFSVYTNYFEKLWNDSKLTKELTKSKL